MTKSRTMSLSRQAFRILGQLLTIVAIIFVLGEVTSRLVFGIQPLSEAARVYMAHERWGWTHVPGSDDEFVRLGARQHIRINALGHRDVEREIAKPFNRKRVLVLGDSAVAGFEVPLEKTWTQVAERSLRARGFDVEVWNVGVRGWGTDQSLLFLQDRGITYAPDVVLYFWNDNDVDDNQVIHQPFRRFGKAWFDLAPDGALVLRGVPVPTFSPSKNLRVGTDGNAVEFPVPLTVQAQMWVRNNVVMTTAFGTALVHVVAGVPQFAASVSRRSSYGGFKDIDMGPNKTDRAFRVTAAMVTEMQRVVIASGGTFRLVPSDEKWVKAIREELGIASLGDSAAFHARMPSGANVIVPLDTHWNELGHELYGSALADCLERSGLLLPGEAPSLG